MSRRSGPVHFGGLLYTGEGLALKIMLSIIGVAVIVLLLAMADVVHVQAVDDLVGWMQRAGLMPSPQ